MHTCQSCRKSLSRKDSLLRHQKQYCKVIRPRKLNENHIRDIHQKVGKTKISSAPSYVKLIQIVTDMLNEHQFRWRKDLKKLKNIVLKTIKYDTSAYYEQYSTDNDERKSTDDEEDLNSLTDGQANSSSE